jgi:hypothetical protein
MEEIPRTDVICVFHDPQSRAERLRPEGIQGSRTAEFTLHANALEHVLNDVEFRHFGGGKNEFHNNPFVASIYHRLRFPPNGGWKQAGSFVDAAMPVAPINQHFDEHGRNGGNPLGGMTQQARGWEGKQSRPGPD